MDFLFDCSNVQIVSAQMGVSYLRHWIPIKNPKLLKLTSVAVGISLQLVVVSVYIIHVRAHIYVVSSWPIFLHFLQISAQVESTFIRCVCMCHRQISPRMTRTTCLEAVGLPASSSRWKWGSPSSSAGFASL